MRSRRAAHGSADRTSARRGSPAPRLHGRPELRARGQNTHVRSPSSCRAGLPGLDAPLVTVEVHLAGGLPAFNLVGLPETEVKESRDRVRAALQNAQFEFPARKITVNLAPADLPKESGRFDLPIALGVLAATGQIPAAALPGYEFAGELALTGALRPIRGALPMALSARTRRARVRAARGERARGGAGARRDRVSRRADCWPSARISPGANCSTAGTRLASPSAACANAPPILPTCAGRPQAKRALTIAAAGGHSLLMIGPPGHRQVDAGAAACPESCRR